LSVLTARGRGASSVSALPLAYFVLAHVSLALALVILAIDPALPGAFFYHARMIAVVHLLTIGWITGSILGAFYIVGPLALGMTMPVRGRDWTGFAAFWIGAAGMVSHFWMGRYGGMAWSAGLVLAAIANLAPRGCHGVCHSVPWGVRVHVRLAFSNMLFAGLIGILIGLDKSRGFLGISPLAATFAHAHLAALGWGAMMVMGLSYRLMPMMLPAAMPSGGLTAVSAFLLEAGLVLLVPSLILEWPLAGVAALCITMGLCAFAAVMIRTARARLPRPPALPARDWSIWQVHAAFIWLTVAAVIGVTLARGDALHLQSSWWYGVAGLLGFLGQIIAGMHGRLLPFYAWYRATAGTSRRPARSAHSLIAARLAALVFWCWAMAVPALGAGLALANSQLIRSGSLLLLAGVAAGATHLVVMLSRAHRAARKVTDDSGSRSPVSAVPHHSH
jgi:hypothetical protein